jgi:hypothetical protein
MRTNPYQPPRTENCLRSVLLWTAITFAALGLLALVDSDPFIPYFDFIKRVMRRCVEIIE